MRYNKDMTISQILFTNPKVLQVFKAYGLPCQNCLGAETETLEEVSRIFQIELNQILCDLEELDN